MSTNLEEEEAVTHVGAHELRREPPDLLWIRLIGDVSEADVYKVIEAARGATASAGVPLFWLIDLSRAGSVGSETRRTASAIILPDMNRFIAFGGSFQQRVIVKLAATAALMRSMRWSQIASLSPDLVDTEADARALVHRLRAQP